jgi:pimeloyl-ACP methyl ester carboxylesterase
MPTIQANDIQLFYEVRGDGEPLLLIAGFACDHLIWSLVEPSLTSRYRVISFDNRGVGQSSAPDRPYSIPQMAQDAAALLEEMGVREVHVAGYSMGGQIAQELALAHPDKVLSLLLLSSCAKGDERGKSLIETFGELPRLVDPRTSARIIFPWLYTNAFFSKPEALEQLMKWLIECPFPTTPQGMYHQSRAIAAFDTVARLGAIRCPTLVLVGKEDILVPSSFSEQLAEGIPNAELVVLEKTGHGLLIETPEAVATVMLDFLSRQRPLGN